MSRMTRGQTRLLAISLVALGALLVGFHGASTLLTVTQLGASPTNGPVPKSHASLVPQPPVPTIKPSGTASAPMPAPRAGESVADEPAAATVPNAVDTPMPSVPNNQIGIAAAAKAQAQAEMDAIGDQIERPMPQREPRRRYRAPRPELHKVY